MVRPRELGCFTAVGTTGTAVNLATVSAAVPLGLSPLLANAVGFSLAFVWCFFGHARWTFPAERRDLGLALRRFAVLSLLGFALTEAAYAWTLKWSSVDYRLALFLVIVTLAGGKLLASKHWAFARH